MERSFQLFHPNTCFISMGFVAVSTLVKRISTFFHPPQLGTYTYLFGTFSTPTPIGTPTFHLEHPPQVQTVVVGWKFKLTVLHFEFKLFHPRTPVCRPQLLNSCTLIAPKSKTHKAKLLPRYNQLSSIKFDQTYQLEMLKTVTKTTRVEISTLS